MKIPVRWQLTLWYSLLIALVMLVMGAVVFGILRWRLQDSLDDDLQRLAEQVSAEIDVENDEITFLTTPELPAPYGLQVYASASSSIVALGADGQPQHIVSGSRQVVIEAMGGQPAFADVAVGPDDTFRSFVVPIEDVDAGTVVGALQVYRSRGDLDEAIDQLGRTLTFVSPAMLLLAAGTGYVLAGRALRPVARITSLAATIRATDLHQRLALDLPNDELGTLARTFDDMLDRMQRAFEQQREFTGNAAHELRTPLTTMRGQIDLTRTHAMSIEEYREAIDQLDLDLERLTALVEALLVLARADDGRLEVDPAPFDLAVTIDAVSSMFREDDQRPAVALQTRCSPVTVTGDEDLIIQVLVNLVENARRHTPDGGVITLSCERSGDTAVVRVADTGSGIAPEHHDRVFDRFYRVDRRRGGAGLGLAICRAIVERHGGTIRLDSEVGVGTVVEFRLPIEPCHPDETDHASVMEEAPMQLPAPRALGTDPSA